MNNFFEARTKQYVRNGDEVDVIHFIPLVGFFQGFSSILNTLIVVCLKVVLRLVIALCLLIFIVYWTEAYSEFCQTSKSLLQKKLTIESLYLFSQKKSLLNIWQGSEYASTQYKANCLARFCYMLILHVWNNLLLEINLIFYWVVFGLLSP